MAKSFVYRRHTRRPEDRSTVWMNFPEPAELHDYRFLGEDYRERQDIKRQRERWLKTRGDAVAKAICDVFGDRGI
jgi:hypothetical protein